MPLQPPAVPAPPPPPAVAPVQGEAAPVASPVAPALTQVPRTAREMRALRSVRSELSDQLTSASNRRSELVRQMGRTEPEAREGIRQRIELLDQRILRLEGEIARTGELAAAAEGNLAATAATGTTVQRADRIVFGGGGRQANYTAIGIIFTLAVLMPIALAMARLLWRRANAPKAPPRQSAEDSQRLLRLEQAIDTIAVEVERISEGQRFVAQLMADQAAAPRALEGVPGAGRGH